MTREEICFTVPAHRDSFVANNKQVAVTIYDYYNRQKAARIFYEPHILNTCEICDKKDCGTRCSKVRRSSKLLNNNSGNTSDELTRDTQNNIRNKTHANSGGSTITTYYQQWALLYVALVTLISTLQFELWT